MALNDLFKTGNALKQRNPVPAKMPAQPAPQIPNDETAEIEAVLKDCVRGRELIKSAWQKGASLDICRAAAWLWNKDNPMFWTCARDLLFMEQRRASTRKPPMRGKSEKGGAYETQQCWDEKEQG